MNDSLQKIRDFHAGRKIRRAPGVFSVLALLGASLGFFPLHSLKGEVFTPSGYANNQNLVGAGWGMDMGLKRINEDYYLTLSPSLSIPIWKFRVGFQIPLDILAYDRDPKSGQKVPSLRQGMYTTWRDYTKLVSFVSYGTHLYYNPDDAFNWSFYYGKMTDGYIGHRTIIHRYVTSYDPTIYRGGLMGDINNTWGGVEVFESDVTRREVMAGRAYVRPFGVVNGVHNFLFADADLPTIHQVAVSMIENRNPAQNGGVFFQEKIPRAGQGGRLGQQFYRPLRRDLKEGKGGVRFEEVQDPITGETTVRAVPETAPPGESSTPTGEQAASQGGTTPPTEPPPALPPGGDKTKRSDEWKNGFWTRWAIGGTVARDYNAPLTLEKDGSGNLVLDPDTKIPRGEKTETLTIDGVDTELRLSPWEWMDVTPYVDVNRFKYLENSKGIHAGINSEFRLGEALKLYVRPEYREVTKNYIPAYFDSYYTLERTNYNPGGTGNGSGTAASISETKLAYLKSLPTDGAKVKGFYGETRLDWLQTLVVEASYEDYQGPNNSQVFVGFYVPSTYHVFLNGYYTKKNFNSIKESFIYDDRSLAAGEMGVALFGGFYVKVSFFRTWQYNQNTSRYDAVDQTVYGFGFSSTL